MGSTGLNHVQVNVTPENALWYRELFDYFGWTVVYTHEIAHGVRGPNGAALWFESVAEDGPYNRDGRGVNHIAIGAESIADVDAAAAWLRDRGVVLLFGTPCHRPEFTYEPGRAYYQIMFESPDGILFEYVYQGPA